MLPPPVLLPLLDADVGLEMGGMTRSPSLGRNRPPRFWEIWLSLGPLNFIFAN